MHRTGVLGFIPSEGRGKGAAGQGVESVTDDYWVKLNRRKTMKQCCYFKNSVLIFHN